MGPDRPTTPPVPISPRGALSQGTVTQQPWNPGLGLRGGHLPSAGHPLSAHTCYRIASLQGSCEGAFPGPVFQMSSVRHKEVKDLPGSHTSSKCQSLDLNLSPLTSKPQAPTVVYSKHRGCSTGWRVGALTLHSTPRPSPSGLSGVGFPTGEAGRSTKVHRRGRGVGLCVGAPKSRRQAKIISTSMRSVFCIYLKKVFLDSNVLTELQISKSEI